MLAGLLLLTLQRNALCKSAGEIQGEPVACLLRSRNLRFPEIFLFQAVFSRLADENYSFARDSLLRQLIYRSRLPYIARTTDLDFIILR